MRIKLSEGKQKELVDNAKKDATWKELSELLNLNPVYLRNEIRTEKRLISKVTYDRLCKITKKDYDCYIINKLNDNWGKVKGGKNSSAGLVKKIKIPEDSIKLAEFYGIMLGDGNLTKIKRYKVGAYQIRIVGDSRHDYNYLSNYVKPLIENLFSIDVKLSKIKNENAITLTSTGKALVEFLEEKGFKPGNKIKNQLNIPSWIKENKEYLKACLRGVYDTDGSAYKLTNQNSYQICFTNYNNTLINEVRNSLISLGIGISQITKGRDIVITKKSELRKFLKDIGFSNIRHISKTNLWNI